MGNGEDEEGGALVPAAELAAVKRRLAETEEALKRALAEKAAEVAQARAQADLASRAKSAFLANMSHEIRTPLSAVMGYANLIAATEAASGETRDWSRRLQRSAEHLLALLDDVLDLAKIEAGKLDLHLVSADPTTVLEEVGVLMEPRAVEKGLELTVAADTELPARLRTDPLRLKQILVNLVGNAIKYTPRGEVTVQARLRTSPVGRGFERRLEIEVADTGVGIPSDELERLFRPFEQGRTRPRSGGVGLGLDISRRLARLLGGEIEARSEVGVGSVFLLVLPVETGADRGTTPARLVTRSGLLPQAPAAPRLDGRRILVVDDAEDNRTILTHFLRQAGAEVVGAAGVAEAEAALFAVPGVDAVVTDLQLADGDGLTLVRRMSERGDLRPVLALTADAMLETRERAMAAGVSDFLVKPVVAWRLVSRVAAMPTARSLEVREAPREARTAGLAALKTPSLVRTDGGDPSPSRPSSRPALKRVPTTPTGIPIAAGTAHGAGALSGPGGQGGATALGDSQRALTAPSPRVVPHVEPAVRAEPDTAPSPRPVPEEGRPDVPDELIERFYALLEERVYAIDEALSAREPARLRDIGHRIAGSGATMGYPELTELGRALERSVASGDGWTEIEARAVALSSASKAAASGRKWLMR